MQTRLQSLIEVAVSTLVAMCISVATGTIIYPLFGHKFSFGDNVWITVIFTVISIVRSYITRRIFNHLHRAQP
jgi:hypothetical protein